MTQSKKRKITPAMIAGPQVRVAVPDQRYDHAAQRLAGEASVIFATTWNATQTFNSKGQPSDKDNDK